MTDEKHWNSAWSSGRHSSKSWYQSNPDASLRWIRRTGISPDSGVIDVGGGASHLTESLLAEGYTDLTVLDISAQAILRARERMGATADRVNWIVADITRFQARRQYELWHDRAALHFLTHADQQQQYVRVLEKALMPGGHVVIATFAVGGPQKCSGLAIAQYDEIRISKLFDGLLELQDAKLEIHLTPGGAEQVFSWFHLWRRA